jgi:hypothetical protein
MDKSVLQFLIKSRQSTYASGMKAEIINGGKTYVIKSGNLEYRDTYFDQHLIFQGQEVLFEDGQPVWSMSYRGAAVEGVDAGAVFAVLQKFIKEYSDKVRFGNNFQKDDGEFKYICTATGEIGEFNGREEIYQNGKLVHWMNYFGGSIK